MIVNLIEYPSENGGFAEKEGDRRVDGMATYRKLQLEFLLVLQL